MSITLLEKIRSQKWTSDYKEGVAELERLCSLAQAAGSASLKPEIDQAIADMINGFLRWPLPEHVAADGCATRPGKGRIGTNLLTAPEAMMLMQQVVRPRLEELLRDLGLPNKGDQP